LRAKTSDLFKAVVLNDFDIIFLFETSLVNSFHDEGPFDDRYFIFRCDRSAASSSKKSGGSVLIAVKRDFDVDVISTRHGLRIAHECVRVKCSEHSYYISAVYLAPDVGKSANDMFVEDLDARVTNRILVLGDCNLPKVKWAGSRRMYLPCCPWASRLILRVI
jgi:hypothetical protein